MDPETRRIYDAQYTFTKFSHTTPQANQSTNSTNAATHKETDRVSTLTLRIGDLKSRLHRQEADLHLARLYLAKLHGEIAGLDQDIKNIEREQSSKATWWGYLTSILQGHQETEAQRMKRDSDRLQKIAARSIKDSKAQQQIAAVRSLENAIGAIHRSITSAEFEVLTEKSREAQEKRRMEEERFRQETRRMAEELRKQQERQAQQANRGHKYPNREQRASGSRNSGQSEEKQNFHDKKTCHHQGWWSRIDVRTSCSRCSSITRKFIFQCPGCGKLACASCRDTIKGGRFRSNRFGKGTYHDSSQFTDSTSYFGRDDY